MILNKNSSNLLRIYIDLDSLTFLSKKEVSFSIHLCFILRFELESSEIFGFDSVSLIFGLNSENKSVILFFFCTGSNPLSFLPSSSQFPFSAIALEFAAFGGEFALEL